MPGDSGENDGEGSGGSSSPFGNGAGSSGDGADPVVPPGEDPQMVQVALTPFTVPEYFPIVPVIAISRHPIFPTFVKIIEV